MIILLVYPKHVFGHSSQSPFNSMETVQLITLFQQTQVLSQTLSAAVRLDQYPKSLIDLSILVLEDDGSAFAAAVTCASIALAVLWHERVRNKPFHVACNLWKGHCRTRLAAVSLCCLSLRISLPLSLCISL